jgi:hypothetical protein
LDIAALHDGMWNAAGGALYAHVNASVSHERFLLMNGAVRRSVEA